MSDFSIDIELSLAKSEREAMATLDRLERQFKRLNSTVSFTVVLDTSKIDAQLKTLEAKFKASGARVAVALPDDRAIAQLEAKTIASSKRIQEQSAKLQNLAAVKSPSALPSSPAGSAQSVSAGVPGSTKQNIPATSTSPSSKTPDPKPFPSSIELGSQSLNAIRNLQVSLIAAIDRGAKLTAEASKQSVLKSIASIAGGQLVSSGVQNVVSNKALQQAAIDKAQSFAGGENYARASEALKGLIADQPMLQKLKDSTSDFVASLRAIEGVEPLIQASQKAFQSMQSAIDRVKEEFASLSEKVGFTATVQAAYLRAQELTAEAFKRMEPAIEAVRTRISELDERFQISAKIQSLSDAAANAYTVTLGVLVDKIKALDAQYKISEDAIKDFTAAFEFSKGVAKDFADDVKGRFVALGSVFAGVGDILAEEFAALASESPKLLAAFTALEGFASKIPFDKIAAGFEGVKVSIIELKRFASESFEFDFVTAFKMLDIRTDLIAKIDAAAESVAGFASSVKAKSLDIKDAIVQFAVDNEIISTYKNLAEAAEGTAKRLIDQFAGVRESSRELRATLGEVGEKYQGLSNLTNIAANGLKVFEVNVGAVVPFLKQFDGAASGAVVGLSLLERSLQNIKDAFLATQISDKNILSFGVDIAPELQNLPNLITAVGVGLSSLKGRLVIDNLIESMTMLRELNTILESFDNTPRKLLVGSTELSGALTIVEALELSLKKLSSIESKVSINFSEILEAEIVSERLLLAGVKLQSAPPLLLKAASPDLDRIQAQIQSVTSLDLSAKPLTIDNSGLTTLQKQIAGLTVNVTATQNFEAIQEAYKLLRKLILDLFFNVAAAFPEVVELGRALKTIQSVIESINASQVRLSVSSSLSTEVKDLREVELLVKSIGAVGQNLKLAPSLDKASVSTDLNFYAGKTIEVKAFPVFKEVYEEYTKLDNTIVNLPFKVESFAEFGPAISSLGLLGDAIESVEKESKLVLTASGLDGAVTAFKSVEASIKSVVSAMDSAARLSNQSLDTLRKTVESVPIGGDKRTKAPLVAQSLIDQEKLATQSLKRLKALADDLKIEPLGNKSTKAAYITAIEEFILAGGKIGDAWKRTESTFKDVAKAMKVEAEKTGASMVEDMNHSAADTVAEAWKRTEGVFEKVTKSMIEIAEKAGAALVREFTSAFLNIQSASKDIDIKINTSAIEKVEEIDSKKLKLTVDDIGKLGESMVSLVGASDNLSRVTIGLKMLESVSGKIDGSDISKLKTQVVSLVTGSKGLDKAAEDIAKTASSIEKVEKVDAKKINITAGDIASLGQSIVSLATATDDMSRITAAMTLIGSVAGKVDASNIAELRGQVRALVDDSAGLKKITSGIDKLRESASTVTDAWKRTNLAFHASTDDMVVQAQETGGKLVDNLNHRAADTTGNAWKRTLKTFKNVVGDMVSGATGAAGEINNKFKQVEIVAKNVGAEIAFAIDSASKTIRVDADFSKAIDKTKEAAAQLQEKIQSIRPPAFDDVMEKSTEGIRGTSGAFNGLVERIIEFKNNPPPFKEMAASAAGSVVGIAVLTGGILALVAAAKTAVDIAGSIARAWIEATSQLIQGGQRIFEVWRDVSSSLIQGATSTVEAWKSASSVILSTGQSIVSAWQSVTSSVVSGGKQLYDTWKGATDSVAGFAASSVKAYADVETSIKAVSGILDLSTKQSEDLFNSVQKTGQEASNKFSTKQISALAATLAKGGKQVDEIKSLLAPIATGATAIGEEDLSKFGGNFLDVVSKFGIPLKDSQKAVELYVKTLTSAKLDASNFANTIKYANVEKEGIEGLKDLSAQTIAFAQVGTRGSKVGTDVNRVMTELAIALEGTSKKAERQRDILKELGLAEEFAGEKAKDVVSRLPQLAAAFNKLEKETGRDNAIAKFNELLGSKGTQAILSFSKVSAEKFQEVRADLEKVASGATGVVKKFAALATSGVSGAIVVLQNNLETVQASLGRSLSKTVAGFATIGTSILGTIGGEGSPVFKALANVGEKVEKLFSAGGKGEELASRIGKAFEGIATKGVGVFANQIESIVAYFSDTKNINEFTKRIEYLGYVFVEVYKIATQLIGGFAAVAFQVVGAIQSFSQSSSGQALGSGINSAFTTIATGGASLLEGKIQSIQAYFSDQTNVENFTRALQFVGKAALLAYSALTDMLATMYRMSVAAIGIVDTFSKTDVGGAFFKSLNDGFKDLSEQAIALTTKRLQEFSDHLQKGDNAAQFAAQLKAIGELSLFAYDGLTQAIAGLANIGLQAAKTTNDFLKSQDGVRLIDELSGSFKRVGEQADGLIQKGLGQIFDYLSQPGIAAGLESIAVGFLRLYDGLTRIVGIGFDGVFKLGVVLGEFFQSPKGQTLIDKLVDGFQKLMDVGINFLLEQLDRFTEWANGAGNLDGFVDLLKTAAELWLTNYIGLTKFNLEMASFAVNAAKGLQAFAGALEFKNTPLLDTSATLKQIDEMTEKLAGFRLYSEESKRMEKEKSGASSNFFSGATEAFMVTLAPAIVNIKAAVDDFMKNGAPALGQIFATFGVSLGIVAQVLGNALALVIRVVTAALPIINVILQPILGYLNLFLSGVATAFSVVTSGVGAAAGLLNTFLSGTLDPIAQFIGGAFNGGIKNFGIFATVVAQGFKNIEVIIAPVVALIAESFVKLPENAIKIFGAVKDIIEANWGAITTTTNNTVRSLGDGVSGIGRSIGSSFDAGKNAVTGFGDSVKSGAIAKLEEARQLSADLGLGISSSWNETMTSVRQNYDDFALNFGVTSQQTDQFFINLNNSIKAQWEGTVNFVTQKWGEFTGFFAAIADALNMKWIEVTSYLSSAWTAMSDAIGAKWNEVTTFIGAAWAAVMSALQPYIDLLVAGFTAAVTFMRQSWDAITQYLVNAWNGVVNTIVSGFQAAMNAVGGSAQNTGNALIGFFTQAANAIGSVFAQIGQGISAFFQPAIEAVNTIVDKLSQARSFGDGLGQVLSGKAFQGARADGGPVVGGAGSYLVGERGPEIFVPTTSGYIIPNHAIDGFRAEGGPVTAGKTYVVGEIGVEAFVPGSGKKTASLTLDFSTALSPVMTQLTRAGDHLNTIALGIKNIQQNAYSIASQTKKGFADVIAKIPVGGIGGGFSLPNFGGLQLPGVGGTQQQSGPQTLEDKITAGLKLATPDVKRSEGFRANAYDDGTGVMTIGYGETRSDVVARGTISEGEAAKLMVERLSRDFLRPALALLSKDTRDKLTPGQIAAIASFAYNTGIGGFEKSSFGSSLIKGDISGARAALPTSYINPGTNVEAGLRNRRQGELKLFNSTEGQTKGDGGVLTQLPGSFGQATGSTKVAGTLPKLSVSSLGVGSAQEYGASRDGGARRHAGQDIDVFYTDPSEGKMYSMLGGIVIKNWEDPRDYFNFTDIYNPGQNLVERIAERGPSLVREGQEVKPGQVVSKGVAGQASAIHYEIRKVEKDASSKYGVKAVSPGLGVVEGTYDPIKKLEELGLGRRSGSDFIGSGQVLSSNGGGGGQQQSSGGFSLPGASILTYEQFAGQKGDGGVLTQLPGSISAPAQKAAEPIKLPTLTLPKTVSGKGGTKQQGTSIDPNKLKLLLKDSDLKALTETYDKSKGMDLVPAKLLPKVIRDAYNLSGSEDIKRTDFTNLLTVLRRLMGADSSTSTGFSAKSASLSISTAEFKKAADLATEASSKGVDIPVELLNADFKKAVGKSTGSIKAVELLKVLSELKTVDPTKYSSVSSEAIDRIAYIASLNDGERKTLDDLVERLERDKRDRVVASELPEAVRKLLGVKAGDESVTVDRIKTLIKEIGELPISLPADLETALASLSERELKNAIETIKDAQRAGDKAILGSSLTPELRKGLGLKPSTKVDISKLVEILPLLEGRLAKIGNSKEIGRLEQILKFNKITLSSTALDALEKQFTKVIEAQKFDLASLGKDELNALEKLGILRTGALGVGEDYIDASKLKQLYGEGATIADAVSGTFKAVGDANQSIIKAQESVATTVGTIAASADKLPQVPTITLPTPPTTPTTNPQPLPIVTVPKVFTPATPPSTRIPNSALDSLDSADLSVPTNSALKNSAAKSITDRIREAAVKTGRDAFAIQIELQKQGLKAIGSVGGTGLLPTISEIQAVLNSSPSFVERASSTSINDRIREIVERTGLDVFKIQNELQKAGLKAIGAVGGKGVLPTIAEIQALLKDPVTLTKPILKAAVSAGLPVANTIKPLKSATVIAPIELPDSLLDSLDFADLSVKAAPKTKSNPILDAAKKVGNEAFAIQNELQKQGLKAIGAVGGKGILPTINEIKSTLDSALKSSASIPVIGSSPLAASMIDSIAISLGVDSKIFAGVDLKDPFAIQKALEKAGYRAIGSLGVDGKTVKGGAKDELPTIDRIQKAVAGAMDANKGLIGGLASSTTATLDAVQAQTSDVEAQIAKLYGVDATGLTGLSGFALATEIQKRVQAKGGRAVGGLKSTKANELPTISEINSKLVDLSKAIDSKQSPASQGSATQNSGFLPGFTSPNQSTPTAKPGAKKFEFSFGGDGDIASREEVEGKLKQFEQYLNSDEFLAVAVEMVLNALKNDPRARLFTGLL